MRRFEHLESGVKNALQYFEKGQVLSRIFQKDPSLWPNEDFTIIRNRLGWIDVLPKMEAMIPELQTFAERAMAEGFQNVVVLGMGGSSLCPEVFSRVFGNKTKGPPLLVLDSTDPEQVDAIERQIDLKRTLFCVASKSGTTAEIDAFDRYFYSKVPARSQFIAITDAGTPLERRAKEESFRHVFINPSDIGGRFSALSLFGLVPAALMGMDIRKLLDTASREVKATLQGTDLIQNEAFTLGAFLAAGCEVKRNKLSLFFSPELKSLGLWIEQLVAESTGKKGVGLVPVVDPPPLKDKMSHSDEVAVITELTSSKSPLKPDIAVHAVPTISYHLDDPYELGALFFRWEMATALAGVVLGINPFDEPNVTESKDITKSLLSTFEKTGKIAEPTFQEFTDGIRAFTDPAVSIPAGGNAASLFRTHLGRMRSDDFVAVLAYLPYDPQIVSALETLRIAIAQKTGRPVTVGFGPRFLHSTGQLHKGGPNQGIFIQITRPVSKRPPVPGLPYSFGILQQAQARGDFQALVKHERRVIELQFLKDVTTTLRSLSTSLT